MGKGIAHNEEKIFIENRLFFSCKIFKNMYDAISDQRSAISDQRSAISDQRSAISDQRSAISDQRS
ncbi:MAG: hypothetical protein LBO82_08325, partial [Synergistaceae bacterium]|nr:hypothetical protein [Synergistaceae bacterium]